MIGLSWAWKSRAEGSQVRDQPKHKKKRARAVAPWESTCLVWALAQSPEHWKELDNLMKAHSWKLPPRTRKGAHRYPTQPWPLSGAFFFSSRMERKKEMLVFQKINKWSWKSVLLMSNWEHTKSCLWVIYMGAYVQCLQQESRNRSEGKSPDHINKGNVSKISLFVSFQCLGSRPF